MNYLGKYACYFYIILWMMYYLQEMLMIAGIIAQTILVILIFISFYAFFQVNLYYQTGPYLKCLNFMLLVITIYGLILFFSGFAIYPDEFNIKTGLQFGYLQRFYTSVLPIYVFYLFSLKGDLSENNIIYVFIMFLVCYIMMYYQNYFIVSEAIDKNEITNNMGYNFVPLIPLLALLKLRDVWKFSFLIIIFAYIMMSMKRGAIVVGTLALILYLKHYLKHRSTKHVLYILLSSVAVICVIYWFVMNLYETSDYFKSRLSSTMEGDTSTRSWMYPFYFEFFIHRTSGLEFLFGCGANATYLRLGEYAHNDWLEFAINQGIFGVLLYIIYWISYVWEWKYYVGPLELSQALGDIIIIYFIVALFSMSFDGMPTAATLCIGYCLAQNEKAKSEQFLNELKSKVLLS